MWDTFKTWLDVILGQSVYLLFSENAIFNRYSCDNYNLLSFCKQTFYRCPCDSPPKVYYLEYEIYF